jgi:predicted metalloprotease with PDZ domain
LRTFRAGAANVVLGLRPGSAIRATEYEAKLGQLVTGASTYLGVAAPGTVYFGIDQLNGRKTYAPGNNESSPGRSSTLLLEGVVPPTSRKFWGTYAHEFAHSWMPRAFGKTQTTREELGSVFIEGFTDYLGYRIAHASALHTDAQFLEALSQFYLEYREAAAARPKGNPEFLRYRQGMMAAWMLDLELLKTTNGRAGFRELMRLLLKQHADTDGITRAEMKAALRSLGGSRTAALYDELTDISRPIGFARHLAGTGLRLDLVGDFKAALAKETRVLDVQAQGSAQRRFIQQWLAK